MSPEPKRKRKAQQLVNEPEAAPPPSPRLTPQHTPSRKRNVSGRTSAHGQGERATLPQDQAPGAPASPPQTPTPTSRPTAVPHSTSSAGGSRDAPIEILSSSEDEPLSASRARRRLFASPDTPTPSKRPRPALGVTRPKAKIRSVSDPLPRRVSKPEGFRNSDAAIEELIRRSAKIRKDKMGAVYVLSATHEGENIVKIGHTVSSVDQRIKTIERTCRGTIKFDRSKIDLHPTRIKLCYGIVEKLAHAELQDSRYNFDCACKTHHREYFKATRETATHVVERWIRFCKAEPWQHAGAGKNLELKGHWDDRLTSWKKEHAPPASAGEPKARREKKRDCQEENKTRRARWDSLVETSRWDWLWYDVRVWSDWLSRYMWQSLVVVLCVVIRFLVRDRGWLARVAEWMMLVTIVQLGGFKCAAAEGLLEPLLKTVWTVTTAVFRGETSDADSRKSDDNDDEWDDGDDGDSGDGKADRREGGVEGDDGSDGEGSVERVDENGDMDVLPSLPGSHPTTEPNNCQVTGSG